MSIHAILNEDWSEYDDRKKRGGSDYRNFACSESWEVDYLVRKIHKQHPEVSTERIRTAIKGCCETINTPRPRPRFVECVLKRLGLQ
jgi:hypothetical protein